MSDVLDPGVAQDLTQLAAARDADSQKGFLENFRQASGIKAMQESAPAVTHWFAALPKNVPVGMIDAAVNTADTSMHFLNWMQETSAGPDAKGTPSTSATKEPKTAGDVSMAHNNQVALDVANAVYSKGKNALMAFRDELAQGSTTSDEVTQSISQYAIPFLGYSKLIGGLKGANWLQTAGRAALSEALTASTVLTSHDARFADVMALGKHTEGKFADAMNTVAPDGSLMNSYINYMTNRDNEGEMEGRFKNVVDNLALSAATAGLLKTTATTLRGGRMWAESLSQNVAKDASTAIDGSKQQGMVAFHGSPYDFNAFDASKIGTGEGHQSFGHGLYFAENPQTAGTYQLRLAQSRAPEGSAMNIATSYMQDAAGDRVKAYKMATDKALVTADPALRDNFKKAAGMIKAGNADLQQGKMYTVDIPDEKVGSMLQWDKPLRDQPEVAKLIGGSKNPNATGQYVYKKLSETFGSDEAASKYLAERGVPGIKYLDQGSRDKGAGTHNIVLFDPNDAKIVKKQVGTKEVPIEKAQSASRTESAKAAEANAPKTGVHVMQTGDKEWTLFVNGKASHVYDKASNAMEDLKALENK